MFWAIAAVVVPTLASVGASIGQGVVQNQQVKKQIENQKDNVLAAAYVKNGTAMGPPPLRIF